jgi:hypothetical protein
MPDQHLAIHSLQIAMLHHELNSRPPEEKEQIMKAAIEYYDLFVTLKSKENYDS